MPKTTKSGTVKKSDLPGPVRRSSKKARRTFAKTYDSAMETYQDEGRASAAAYASLKHSYEKVGDHWERKEKRGPSDARAEQGGPNPTGKSAGGVDANASKEHLLKLARRLEVKGRSTMTKAELVDALQQANDKANRDARTR